MQEARQPGEEGEEGEVAAETAEAEDGGMDSSDDAGCRGAAMQRSGTGAATHQRSASGRRRPTSQRVITDSSDEEVPRPAVSAAAEQFASVVTALPPTARPKRRRSARS
eukprot:6176174-Pleurochrysis_carterae.AAC.1